MKINTLLQTTIRNYSLLLFVVCFFFFPRLQTIFVGLAFTIILFQSKFYLNFYRNSNNAVGLSMLIYFGILTLSLLYTTNVSEGLKSLETKLSFLVFPIFLPFIISDNNKLKYQILNVVVCSGLSYVFLSLIRAAMGFFETGDISLFFYGDLGIGFFQEGNFLHPTYGSLLFNFLIAYLGVDLVNGKYQFSSKLFSVILIVVFAFFILLLSSKFGILALGVNLVMLLIYFVRKVKKIKLAFLILFGFGILSGIVITQTPLKKRFEAAYIEIAHPSDKEGSTKTRKDVWNVTIDIISENPILGVGTGDIRDVLSQEYKARDFNNYLKRNYDSHQQFLQTFAATGFFGFLSLLMIFVLLFYRAFKKNNYLLFIFTLLFFLFGMVESMLERQAGITFFTFFGLFLYFYNPTKETK